jgi:hypothetical protein
VAALESSPWASRAVAAGPAGYVDDPIANEPDAVRQASALGQFVDEPDPGTFHTVVIEADSPPRTRSIGLHTNSVAVSVPVQVALCNRACPASVSGIGIRKVMLRSAVLAGLVIRAT